MGLFLNALKALQSTCGSYVPPPGISVIPPWPTTLAIEPIRGSINDIHTMTWGRGDPGYATFTWSFENGELAITLRRIGGKTILLQP